MKIDCKKITEIILKHQPNCQAIYLFGSFASGQENKNSDVDIALLLPYFEAKKTPSFVMSELLHELSMALGRDVDLVNIRAVSTVFQIQIIDKGKIIFCADKYAKDVFEMLALSFYQKLNGERKGILEDILNKSWR
jgi:predicted nucleotidyltransferase